MARTRDVTTLPASDRPKERMSYEAFLAAYDGERAEWVDGEVFTLAPLSIRHQRVLRFLLFVVSTFAKVRGLGEVLPAGVQMRLTQARTGREPDIMFVANEHLDRLLINRLEGPADLAVEIVSPESRDRDWRVKLAEYETAGVSEYWIVDPESQRAAFFRRDPGGHYQPIVPDKNGIVHSAVLPGLWLRLDWLWEEPTPELRAVQELGLLRITGGSE